MIQSAHTDPLPNRMIALGCALLLMPCLFTLIALGYFGWPVIVSWLPRDMRPIQPAAEGEILFVIADFAGSGMADPADDIAQQIRTNFSGYTTVRLARPVSAPETAADARALGQQYRARVVIWGIRQTDGYTLSIEVLQPVDPLQPQSTSLIFAPADSNDLNTVSQLLTGIAFLHTSDGWNASAHFDPLSASATSDGLTLETLTVYRLLAYQMQGSYPQAEQAAADAVRQQPRSARLHLLYAQVLIWNSKTTQAIDAASDALKYDADLIEAYVLRGMAYAQLEKYSLALSDFDEALKRDPAHEKTRSERIRVYIQMQEYDQALADINAALAINPDNVDMLLQRAQIDAAQGNQQAAYADLARVLEIASAGTDSSLQASALLERARIARQFKDTAQALADYDALLKLFPNDSGYTLEKGMAYWERGDKANADATFMLALADMGYTADGPGLNNLAWELAMKEYYEPALGYSIRSLGIDPHEPNSLHTRGYIYLHLKEYDRATLDIEAAFTYGLTGYNPAYRDLADAYFGAGKYDLAVRNYDKYLTLETAAVDREAVTARRDEAARLMNAP
jgi:tetratricopeptide (TPR) repeat protein